MNYSNTNFTNSSSLFMFFSLKKWIIIIIIPILLALIVFLFQIEPFDPAPFPTHELGHKEAVVAPKVNGRMLNKAEFIGSGSVLGPEDVVYEPRTRTIYTGCADGWVKRVKVDGSVVEDWVNTGGRPLGIAITSSGDEVILAHAHKGLLKITMDKEITLLTDEAEGKKFKLTDGVDIAKDGTIYFTDASYKYDFETHLYDLLGTRPYGRLLSYNPNTRETKVLLQDLYFPNGVSVSPDQKSIIFCESTMLRCKRYWIQGEKKGELDAFVNNLPGYPDNIHSDGHSNYWIAISCSFPTYLEQVIRNRLVRKAMLIMNRYIKLSNIKSNGGILGVDLEGNPTVHVFDPSISAITSGIKVEDHLYIGSLHYSHIIRFNLSYT